MPRKTDKLNIRIDPVVKEALQRAAEDEHRSVGNMVEVLVLTHCKEKKIPVRKISGKKNA
jgi:hypothetical protein